MPRSAVEIANDLKAAVQVMAETNKRMAETATGNSIPNTPTITVRLPDGREVELGALADELLQSLSG